MNLPHIKTYAPLLEEAITATEGLTNIGIQELVIENFQEVRSLWLSEEPFSAEYFLRKKSGMQQGIVDSRFWLRVSYVNSEMFSDSVSFLGQYCSNVPITCEEILFQQKRMNGYEPVRFVSYNGEGNKSSIPDKWYVKGTQIMNNVLQTFNVREKISDMREQWRREVSIWRDIS